MIVGEKYYWFSIQLARSLGSVANLFTRAHTDLYVWIKKSKRVSVHRFSIAASLSVSFFLFFPPHLSLTPLPPFSNISICFCSILFLFFFFSSSFFFLLPFSFLFFLSSFLLPTKVVDVRQYCGISIARALFLTRRRRRRDGRVRV